MGRPVFSCRRLLYVPFDLAKGHLLSASQDNYDSRYDIDGSSDGYIDLADFEVCAQHWLTVN